MSTVRVIVVDPQPLSRLGLVSALEQPSEIEIVAEYASALVELAATPADVLVAHVATDWPASPIAWITGMRRTHPDLPIVVLCAAHLVPDLMDAGAQCALSTSDSVDALLLAVRNASIGRRYVAPLVKAYLVSQTVIGERHRLTPRELCVLQCIAQGWGTAQIANHYCLDKRTIQNRITTIRAKTGCGDRAHMATWYQALYGPSGDAVLELPTRQPAAVQPRVERDLLDVPRHPLQTMSTTTEPEPLNVPAHQSKALANEREMLQLAVRVPVRLGNSQRRDSSQRTPAPPLLRFGLRPSSVVHGPSSVLRGPRGDVLHPAGCVAVQPRPFTPPKPCGHPAPGLRSAGPPPERMRISTLPCGEPPPHRIVSEIYGVRPCARSSSCSC